MNFHENNQLGKGIEPRTYGLSGLRAVHLASQTFRFCEPFSVGLRDLIPSALSATPRWPRNGMRASKTARHPPGE
jgi:hypothetical protein